MSEETLIQVTISCHLNYFSNLLIGPWASSPAFSPHLTFISQVSPNKLLSDALLIGQSLKSLTWPTGPIYSHLVPHSSSLSELQSLAFFK